MILSSILLLLAGGGFLLLGAESLVRGASRVAGFLGLSPLIIGLTIVAYGTSAPELSVSIQSAMAGQGDIALGNVIGSNIFNVLMILGLSAIATPLTVAQQLIRLDVPIMIGLSGLLLLFSLDQTLQFSDGLILFLGGVVYTVFLIYQSRRETDPEVQAEYAREYSGEVSTGRAWLINLVLLLGGLALLVLGSRLLVRAAITIAQAIGVSELVIGLTIIAVGTSLPELATSAVASWRGERDIAVGNVIGSNIFNILSVVGMAAMISPTGISVPPAAIHFDLPVMLVVAVACLPIFVSGNVISRWEGFLFTGYYAAYTAFLILRTADHDSLGLFSQVMLMFVIPLTFVTLVIVMGRTWSKRSRAKQKTANEDQPLLSEDPHHR